MIVLFACSTAFAQTPYTYNSTQAGQMNSATVPNYATITDLTVTGNIDARDVRFMRDSMTVLAKLDLRGATVVEYIGPGGTYSDDRTYHQNEMPGLSFYYNNGYSKTSLVSVQLPAGLTSIGNFAFYGCSGLTGSLTFPAGLTFIGDYAFSGCSGLTGSLTFPAGLTFVGECAFYGCSGLTGSLSFPSGLTFIGGYAFYDCSGLTGSLTLPTDLTSISSGAFYGCRGLTGSLTFPAGLTFIGDGAFYDCDGLTGSLTFPAGLTFIGNGAFDGCSGFTDSLIFPASLTSIGDYAFHDCEGFTSIINFNIGSVSITSDVFSMDKNICTLTVPTSSVNLYKNANVWKDFPNTVGGGLSVSVKSNISTLGSVSGVENRFYAVGEQLNLTATPTVGYGFINWTSGKTVLSTNTTLSLVVTQDTVIIANFGNVATITLSVAGTLKDNVSTTTTRLTVTGNIDARDIKFMRDSMTVLAELDLSGATIVAYNGSDGTYPVNTTYPDNEMPIYSFCNFSNSQGKTSLISVQFPAGMTSIGFGAFGDCRNLACSLVFPAGLTSIGDFAFVACSGLADSLTFPAGLTFVGECAFDGCRGLTGSLTFPSGLTSIGDNAFDGCRGLSGSLTLPAGLTSIGDYAFDECDGFTSIINLNPEPASITSDVFSVDKSTCTLTVPACALSAYESANVWKDFSSIIGDSSLSCIIVLLNKATVTLVAGETEQLIATVLPADAANKAVTWSSNDTNIATVSDDGLVTAVSAGTATITATTEDGDYTATCLITVINGSLSAEAPQTTPSLQVYPNPTRDKVYFSNPNGVEATLYSPQGKLLQRTHSNSVDLSSYPQGIYLLKVGILTAKVVKH
jgi:hypothetical protein